MSPQHMAYRAYNQAFHTVSKTRQVVMLYDGAIRFLKQASQAMEEKRIQDRFNLLGKVSDIVLGLQSSLDFEHGGSVAKVLYDFYSSVDARILTLHRTNDVTLCNNLIEELKEMRDAWGAVDQNEPADAPARMPVSAAPEAPVTPEMRMTPPSSALPFSSDIVA